MPCAGFGLSPATICVTTWRTSAASIPKKTSPDETAAVTGPVLRTSSRTLSLVFVIIMVVEWCMPQAAPLGHLMSSHLLREAKACRHILSMTPIAIFALVVRIAGLVSLLYLLATSVLFFASGIHWRFVLRIIIWALFSLWLLRGAPQLVRFAYPEDK